MIQTKRTKIAQAKKQTRATIPKEFVEDHNITGKDSIEWKSEAGKLKGELVKNE